MRPCRLVLLLLAVSFVTAAACELAHAHGGGLDSLGCHNDRNRGEYHCHRNELAGRTFASKAEAEKTLAGGAPSGANKPPFAGDLYIWVNVTTLPQIRLPISLTLPSP